MKIPANNKWYQANLGDIFGSIWSSFNLDLRKLGEVMISVRFMWKTSSTGTADFATPTCIKKLNLSGNDFWYLSGGSHIWRGGTTVEAAFVKEDGLVTGEPSLGTVTGGNAGIEVFGDRLYAVTANLDKQADNAASWATVASGTLTTTAGLPIVKYAQRMFFRYRKTQMASINAADTIVVPSAAEGTANTNANALTILDGGIEIVCGTANSEGMWLGMRSLAGSTGTLIHKWVPPSLDPVQKFQITAEAVLAMCTKDDAVWALDSNGVLSQFNGGAFVPKAKFPFKPGKRLLDPAGATTSRLIHPNGMIVRKNGDIAMLINANYDDSTQEENIHSAVWLYNEEKGLHHSGSASLWNFGVTTEATDFGQAEVSAVGALAEVETYDSAVDGDLLMGVTTGGIAYAQFTNFLDTKQKAGYLVTPKIYSQNITDQWVRAVTRFGRKFLNSTDKVVLKYRTEEDTVTEASISWVSTTTFTSSVTGYAVGDEVEVIQGIGAGRCAHITDITGTTFTVDETFTGASGTATARFQSWTKCNPAFQSQTYDFNMFPLSNVPGTWIQFKLWMLWTGKNELHDLIISNNANEK